MQFYNMSHAPDFVDYITSNYTEMTTQSDFSECVLESMTSHVLWLEFMKDFAKVYTDATEQEISEIVAGEKEIISTSEKCVCGNDSLIKSQKQVRSGDEGATIYYICARNPANPQQHYCGRRWHS
jgi:DNA-directed RNA polymerase subunit M/transcription elongation factor TFIIS